MSKPVTKSLIGAFVVGAIALLVLAIAIFGSGRFLERRPVVVMFFEGSVKGLNAGAPVLFRGVPIGSVKEIDIVADPERLSIRMPVYAEFDPDRIKTTTGARPEPLKNLDRLIQVGLRAELAMQSLVTGQLAINLDFFPDTAPVLIGADPRYPEVPTKPTQLQEFLSKVETLPIDELVRNLNHTVGGINKLVNSPELTATVRNLAEVTKDLKTYLANLDHQVERLALSLDQTVKEYGQVAQDADTLIKNVDREVPALAAGLQKSLEDIQATLAQARQTLAKAETILPEDGVLEYELTRTMSEISGAARSIRQLADLLRRDPDALIWGRRASGGH